MPELYADIIIDISIEAMDKTFQYRIPEELREQAVIGARAIVPFGKGNKTRKGYIIGLSTEPKFDPMRTKDIIGIPDKSLQIEGKLISLAFWMKETYGSTMNHALQTVMPVKERVRETNSKEDVSMEWTKAPIVELTEQQTALIEDFETDYDSGKRNAYLLHGVTGSGKTEVYIGCVKKVIEDGGQAILLIPEIGLTYQNVARIRQYFGDRVALIHSRQSKGEKYREMMRAKEGTADVIIGPRSALFAPCRNLKLIILDEEHDMAYKSEQTPKYHARETALKRGELENASVIMGSATPTIESYANAKLGKYKLWELPERPQGVSLSTVSVVDLREELRLGNRSIVSKELHDRIDDCLRKKEQVMLFINRRGYNSFVSCRECGEVIICPKCDVSMSLHDDGFMRCHYCGYINRAPKQCPKCKSALTGGFGTGTQKVEEEIHRLFPQAKTLRMDKDTTMRKGAHGDILNRFLNKKADILIGTQMIVKGHDFENVTLVGVMLADMSLFANDYRAGERTFSLLTQAAGRAGRGEKSGHVLIQTYQPDHYAIQAAAKQDYEGYFDMEMSYRRLMKYPPMYHMMVILLTDKDYGNCVKASEKLQKQLQSVAKTSDNVRIIGPSDATIGKLNDMYRRVIYVKASDASDLHTMKEVADSFVFEQVTVTVDVDPMQAY